MKDLFSRDPVSYASYRPKYPIELFQFLSEICDEKYVAWDCATGNGQAASALSDYFEKVVATDISEAQLKNAIQKHNISYALSGLRCPLNDNSVDLVTVAQALHWLPLNEFYNEVKRVGKKRGIIAVWCYQLPKAGENLDTIIEHFYAKTLQGCWDEGRKDVDNGYSNISFPFLHIPSPEFQILVKWNPEQLIGYIKTWSAIPTYIAIHGTDPISALYTSLQQNWGSQLEITFRFPLRVRIGYIH